MDSYNAIISDLVNIRKLFLQNARTENSVSESKGDEEEVGEESENEDVQRHVEFSIAEDSNSEDACDKPNKLQRRDTPHHLKNKRIQAVDKEKVASIIAQVEILLFDK